VRRWGLGRWDGVLPHWFLESFGIRYHVHWSVLRELGEGREKEKRGGIGGRVLGWEEPHESHVMQSLQDGTYSGYHPSTRKIDYLPTQRT
jgi:hypothetical protein